MMEPGVPGPGDGATDGATEGRAASIGAGARAEAGVIDTPVEAMVMAESLQVLRCWLAGTLRGRTSSGGFGSRTGRLGRKSGSALMQADKRDNELRKGELGWQGDFVKGNTQSQRNG